MIIPDEVRKCVCFVSYQMADASFRLAGTGVFIARRLSNRESITYVVTAKHVIQGIRDLGISLVGLRINVGHTDCLHISIPVERWAFHPRDSSIDIAAACINWSDVFDHAIYRIEEILTVDQIAKKGVGIGDEVFVTGLFRLHSGRRRNIPIVRTGNIASLLEEKIQVSSGDEIDGYLIEARSTGGLSGSPVFVQTRMQQRAAARPIAPVTQYHLLGIMHGHFDSEVRMRPATENEDGLETVNMGIGIVIPAEKILEVLDQPAIRQAEGRV